MASTNTKASSPAVDITTLSDDDLASLAVEVQRELAERKAKAEQAFFAATRDRMAVLGISWERLRQRLPGTGAPRKRASASDDKRSEVRPKYRDPKTGTTWSGRGGAPKWFSDHIAAGGSKDDLRIPEAEP